MVQYCTCSVVEVGRLDLEADVRNWGIALPTSCLPHQFLQLGHDRGDQQETRNTPHYQREGMWLRGWHNAHDPKNTTRSEQSHKLHSLEMCRLHSLSESATLEEGLESHAARSLEPESIATVVQSRQLLD